MYIPEEVEAWGREREDIHMYIDLHMCIPGKEAV